MQINRDSAMSLHYCKNKRSFVLCEPIFIRPSLLWTIHPWMFWWRKDWFGVAFYLIIKVVYHKIINQSIFISINIVFVRYNIKVNLPLFPSQKTKRIWKYFFGLQFASPSLKKITSTNDNVLWIFNKQVQYFEIIEMPRFLSHTHSTCTYNFHNLIQEGHWKPKHDKNAIIHTHYVN